MRIVTDYMEYTVYETSTGKGVLFIKKPTRGNNVALFETSTQAEETALALAFGGSVRLTHRIKKPVNVEAN